MYLWGINPSRPHRRGIGGFVSVLLAASGGCLRPCVSDMGVSACGLDCLIACGLTQVVAALSLRPSAFGLGACAFAWVHQLIRLDSRPGRGNAAYAAAMMLGLITKSDCSTDCVLALVRLYFNPMITFPAFRLMRSDWSPSITGRPRNLYSGLVGISVNTTLIGASVFNARLTWGAYALVPEYENINR